ncbi:MAG: DJ-1/PfpI family protein [Defluviitaleaceae bacterium]|nr:DJ-1/PfpI family protein [Defluviitaleaceae bacterium]
MYDAVMFLTDGFEEIEAIAPLDVLRRGGCITTCVSLSGGAYVAGSHGVTVAADMTFAAFIQKVSDTGKMTFVLPGGPGTPSYLKHGPFVELLHRHDKASGRFAAICAAPSVLGNLGFLDGVRAVCYPGYEKELLGAIICEGPVVSDGRFVTAKAAGASVPFAVETLRAIKGSEIAVQTAAKMYA